VELEKYYDSIDFLSVADCERQRGEVELKLIPMLRHL